jgi:hypothetical protein
VPRDDPELALYYGLGLSGGSCLSNVSKAFGKSFTVGDLTGTDPIVKRCGRLLGVDRYDPGKPATVLLRAHTDILPTLSEATLQRFEALFQRVNATLGT